MEKSSEGMLDELHHGEFQTAQEEERKAISFYNEDEMLHHKHNIFSPASHR